MSDCPHPPERAYAGWYYDPELDGDYLWVGCTLCGALTVGAADNDGKPTGKQHRLSPKKRKEKR